MSINYYHISTKSRNPASPDPEWFAKAQQTLLCKNCGSARIHAKGVDVVLQRVPDKSALNFVHGVCVYIATTEFLNALLPEGTEIFLWLGKVFEADKGQALGVKTVMAHNVILIRGGEKSTFRACTECGHVWYSPVGKRYVLRRDLKDATVLDTGSGSLVVIESVAQRIMNTKWKNVLVQKLEVRDEPMDGIQLPT